MATTEIINKALETLKNHDWYWMMADYSHPAMDYARGSMRYFVELVATITDVSIRKALRDLWTLTYENVHARTYMLTFGARMKNPTKCMRQRKQN